MHFGALGKITDLQTPQTSVMHIPNPNLIEY